MPGELLVSRRAGRTWAALREGGTTVEIRVERDDEPLSVGRIARARVSRVLPGIQSAFLDVGLGRDAFLHGADLLLPGEKIETTLPQEVAADEGEDAEPGPARRPSPKLPSIETRISIGDELLVQVIRESIGSKGARVTSYVTLPGRYVVYMPQARHIGVSRRIKDERERERLRAALRGLTLPPGGFILRTNAEGKGEAEFAHDVEFLSRLWAQIQRRFEQATPPTALHEEMDLTFRVVRDLFSPEVDEFVVDDAAAHEKCLGYVRALVPSLESRVKLYGERAPVFDAFGIEKDIEKALRRRVWLKSGGYIVIDHTEALVSIDVNTGKYVGKRDFEQTVLKTNLEAVNEVVRQIRLRDLGGIIIIDFIDMEVLEHREQVEKAIKRALAEDKARTNVMPISELGLVEMTRKRVRQDLRALLTQHCAVCRGTGVVKSDETLATEIYRAVQAKAAAEAPAGEGRELVARVHPDVAAYIEREGRADLERLQSGLQVKITVQAAAAQAPREEYEIRVR